MDKLQSNHNGELAAYAFPNDETYLRFSYISSRYDDYILFIIIRKTAEESAACLLHAEATGMTTQLTPVWLRGFCLVSKDRKHADVGDA